MIFTNLTRANEIGANCYLLEMAGRRLLLDAGMHPRFDGPAAQPALELLPDGSVEAIVVTHAHQDHVGSLPPVMRRHPRAPAFMTDGTAQLSEIMLHNSVSVMTKRAEESGAGSVLFTHREIDQVARRWRPAPLRQRFDLNGDRLGPQAEADVSLELFDAGHIVGSAGVRMVSEGRTVFYTGDVNFDDQTVMRAAQFPEEPVDVLITETTRGDHPQPEGFSRAGEERRFAEAIGGVLDGGGAVLIPVFALGKTQEVLSMLLAHFQSGLLKERLIHIGGLSTKLTEAFDRMGATPRLLDSRWIHTLSGAEGFAAQVKPGHIYALSSGMMTERTLSNGLARQVLGNPRHGLFFVGYADPESPAGRVRATPAEGLVSLGANHSPQPLRCRSESFSFSGHASREGLLNYLLRVKPKVAVLVHGDPPALGWFQAMLAEKLPETRVVVPLPGVPVEL